MKNRLSAAMIAASSPSSGSQTSRVSAAIVDGRGEGRADAAAPSLP